MPIPKSILERIETFRRNLDSYVKPDYKEAQVRQEFIDPLFSALGWDVANTAGYAEAYKDVVAEDRADKAPHDQISAHVERILGLQNSLAAAKSPDAQTHLHRDLAATDRAIDQLVYQLYGLTPEEIALVEQAPAAPAAKMPEELEPKP